jgi:hypothetical protein
VEVPRLNGHLDLAPNNALAASVVHAAPGQQEEYTLPSWLAVFFGRLTGQAWAFIRLAALGALLLLSALCGRFGLWLSFFSSWSGRLQPSFALERTSIE